MYKLKSFININKIKENLPNIIINYIILPGCLFSSIYILSTTFKLINDINYINVQPDNMKVSHTLNTLHKLNCLTLIISGGIIIYIVFIY
jgi:hypothetical protein